MEPMAKRNRREEIMQAAEELFTSRRFHEITLDDVAGKAEVGKGTVYRYFTDKDDLFFQTAMQGFDELCDLLERAGSGRGPFRKDLLSACKQISEFFHKRRLLFQMMQSEESCMHWRKGELRSRWMDHRESMASAVQDILRRGVEEGVVRGDVSADVLASVLLGMLRTHAKDLAERLGESRSLRTVMNLFLQGAGGNASRRSVTKRPLLATRASTGDRT